MPGLDQQRYAERRVTQPLISQKNSPKITRLPAELAGFCCEKLDCPECLQAYRRGVAFLRQERASKVAPRTRRQPTLVSALKQAAKAGKSVKGAEVHPDRVVLQFGVPEPVELSDPWPLNEFCPKETKQ